MTDLHDKLQSLIQNLIEFRAPEDLISAFNFSEESELPYTPDHFHS